MRAGLQARAAGHDEAAPPAGGSEGLQASPRMVAQRARIAQSFGPAAGNQNGQVPPVQRLQIARRLNGDRVVVFDVEDLGIYIHGGRILRRYRIEGVLVVYVDPETGAIMGAHFEPLPPQDFGDELLQLAGHGHDGDEPPDGPRIKVEGQDGALAFDLSPLCTCQVVDGEVVFNWLAGAVSHASDSQDQDSQAHDSAESDSEEDDGFVVVTDLYAAQGLDLLLADYAGLSLFLASVMQQPIEYFAPSSTVFKGVCSGIRSWSGDNDISTYGPSIVCNGQAFASKVNGTWMIDADCPLDVREAMSNTIWGAIRTTLDSDANVSEVGPGTDLLKFERKVQSLTLRFTGRVDAGQQELVAAQVLQFCSEILQMDCESLVRQLLDQLHQMQGMALDAWAQNTENHAPESGMGDVKLGLRSKPLGIEQLVRYLTAAKKALCDVLASGQVMLVIDAAVSRKAYGGATGLNKTNAQQVMEGVVTQQLSRREMVRINLDATGIAGLKLTLAHELAHIAGFNPAGMGTSGHMEDVLDYLNDEAGTGLLKLLFDAYFFETIYQHFMRSD